MSDHAPRKISEYSRIFGVILVLGFMGITLLVVGHLVASIVSFRYENEIVDQQSPELQMEYTLLKARYLGECEAQRIESRVDYETRTLGVSEEERQMNLQTAILESTAGGKFPRESLASLVNQRTALLSRWGGSSRWYFVPQWSLCRELKM